MRLMKSSLAGLVLVGILALAPTAAFAHGGGGGHFGGGGGHFAGGLPAIASHNTKELDFF